MPYSGLQLDCRYGVATVNLSTSRAANVDGSGFTVPSGNLPHAPFQSVAWSTVYPMDQWSPPGYWNPILPYWLWDVVPPGFRVLCGVTIPDFSADIEATRAEADALDVEYEPSDTAADIMNAIVAWWEAQQP